MKDFIKAIWAGMAIAMGGTVYLSLMETNKIAGAVLFSLGLFTICVLKLNLFTGKAGYLAACKDVQGALQYLIFLLKVFAGNLVGTAISAAALGATRISPLLTSGAEVLAHAKLSDGAASIFILSVFCGILMFAAVECFGRIGDPVGRYMAIILCVAVFILSGFEHCVANMFYYALCGDLLTLNGFGSVCLMAVGNMCGSLLLSLPLLRIFDGKK